MTKSILQRIGLISDTHGLLRPEATALLAGCSLIVHAGDIGGAGILERLRVIAPVTAVRGNNDLDEASQTLPLTEVFRVGRVGVLIVHDRATLGFALPASGIRVVVSGHSHKPCIEERDGILWVNPGSAGPRRFKLPVAIGELRVDAGGVTARVIDLLDPCGSLASGALRFDKSSRTSPA